MSVEAKLRASRTEIIDVLEWALANADLPPNIRAEYTKAVAWNKEYRDRPESREELEWTRDNKLPAYLRGPIVKQLRESGAVVVDNEGTVTVRWDLIPAEDRKAAYSYLNALVDGYRRRSAGGRPKT